jgi:2'-5' RNA ligase
MIIPGVQSGLIVEVSEAEPIVGRYRELLDSSARLGVPAHVTVIFPFMPPALIDAPVLARLQDLFATTSGFDVQLDHTDWFEDRVVWIGPRDPGPFRALTDLTVRAFPEFPPYEGQFNDVIPHLTLGHDRPVADLRSVETAVQSQLPIISRAAAVTLITQESVDGDWLKSARFALA